MARRQLGSVRVDFDSAVNDCRRLAADAYQWSASGSKHRISLSRRDSMTELAFLRLYLAWEGFLEEAFLSYLLGLEPPHGRGPVRFANPPTWRAAHELVLPESRDYAVWDASTVIRRAERFFRDGRPFSAALRSQQSALDEIRKLRNAVAHRSTSSHEKFKDVARDRLKGTLPPGLSVGGFLGLTIPNSLPPSSFFDLYAGKLGAVANGIVRI